MNRPMSLLLTVILLSTATTTVAQGVKATLFDETNTAVEQAREAQLHILSPRNFTKAMDHYQDAERDFKRGGNLDGIREDLDDTARYLGEAEEVAKIVRVSLATLLAARNDAIEAKAAEHAPDMWGDATADFEDAMEGVERGDMNRAQREASDAETQFRQAELTAIKRHYLTTARQTLERADDERADRYAPKTFTKTQRLIEQAEKELSENRYDTDVARSLAQEAEYEARHAIYVSGLVQQVRANDKTVEDVLLEAEQPLQRVADSVDYLAHFDAGYASATEEIVARVEQALTTLQTTEEELSESRIQVAQLESQLGDVSEAREVLATRRQAFQKVAELFEPQQARVNRDENNIIIRLISLNFPSGQSTIEPRNFAMLANVQTALRVFPNSRVNIEGHTDSHGGGELNLKLSEERAVAVQQYLNSNMGGAIPTIEAIGFGETRPVGNNESEAGRAKNRRIDIVIQPDWDQVQLAGT